MHAHTLGRTSFRAADLARSALRGPSPAPRAVLCEAQRSRGMVSTQPLTPWAHLISNAKLQQQKEGFAEPLEFRVRCLPSVQGGSNTLARRAPRPVHVPASHLTAPITAHVRCATRCERLALARATTPNATPLLCSSRALRLTMTSPARAGRNCCSRPAAASPCCASRSRTTQWTPMQSESWVPGCAPNHRACTSCRAARHVSACALLPCLRILWQRTPETCAARTGPARLHNGGGDAPL